MNKNFYDLCFLGVLYNKTVIIFEDLVTKKHEPRFQDSCFKILSVLNN